MTSMIYNSRVLMPQTHLLLIYIYEEETIDSKHKLPIYTVPVGFFVIVSVCKTAILCGEKFFLESVPSLVVIVNIDPAKDEF